MVGSWDVVQGQFQPFVCSEVGEAIRTRLSVRLGAKLVLLCTVAVDENNDGMELSVVSRASLMEIKKVLV